MNWEPTFSQTFQAFQSTAIDVAAEAFQVHRKAKEDALIEACGHERDGWKWVEVGDDIWSCTGCPAVKG